MVQHRPVSEPGGWIRDLVACLKTIVTYGLAVQGKQLQGQTQSEVHRFLSFEVWVEIVKYACVYNRRFNDPPPDVVVPFPTHFEFGCV